MCTASTVQTPVLSGKSPLAGKRVGMVMFSSYPSDPRPRRAVETLLNEGMAIDLVCLRDGEAPRHEVYSFLNVIRVPISHRRGGKLSYVWNYAAFIVIAAVILAIRTLRCRYDLVYVHNMPDILVASALVPKMLGARVILDQHDPMPELMMTIFQLPRKSMAVRLLQYLEKWSIAQADFVITVNQACQRLFASRSCPQAKIGVVMNTPDENIFSFHKIDTAVTVPRAPRRPFVLMYHGSLVERNGLELAVDALERALRAVPTIELRILGRETPFLHHVLRAADHKGISHYIKYLGPKKIENLPEAILKCDVGIIPNLCNTFTDINTPTRIFEYLALGKPVIAPRTAGIEDYFQRHSILYFDAGSATDLAAQMECAFFDYSTLLHNTRAGQDVYLSHRWSKERRVLVDLVETVLSDNGSAS